MSAIGAAGAIIFLQYSCKPEETGIALQLYTIRDAMAADVPGSLKKASDIGYKYIELAGSSYFI